MNNLIPRPGDPIMFLKYLHPRLDYGKTGRIDGVKHWCNDGEIHICHEQGSAFLFDSGNVSISGGPFSCVKIEHLKSTGRVKTVQFWNWGTNLPGAGQGVYFTEDRPLWIYDPEGKVNDTATYQPPEVPQYRRMYAYRRTADQIANDSLRYEYLVTDYASSHTAFKTYAEFCRWLEDRKLSAPDIKPGESASISGGYSVNYITSPDLFYSLQGREIDQLSNGQIVPARITHDRDGNAIINVKHFN